MFSVISYSYKHIFCIPLLMFHKLQFESINKTMNCILTGGTHELFTTTLTTTQGTWFTHMERTVCGWCTGLPTGAGIYLGVFISTVYGSVKQADFVWCGSTWWAFNMVCGWWWWALVAICWWVLGLHWRWWWLQALVAVHGGGCLTWFVNGGGGCSWLFIDGCWALIGGCGGCMPWSPFIDSGAGPLLL